MKISIIQQDILWGVPEENRAHLDNILTGLSGSDLVVLPEMFTTGFATQADAVVEQNGNDTIEWMKIHAAKGGFALAGSIALALPDGKLVNRMYFVKPDGNVTIYDKHHLFRMGGEHERFSEGKERVIVEWMGVRFLLLICYDLRFPVWSRSRGDYDAIIYVANWPEARRYAWQTLLRARAIENQAYVIAANRCGDDPVGHYTGDSAVIGPWGEDIAVARPGEEQVIEAEIIQEKVVLFRQSFAALNDADNFILA